MKKRLIFSVLILAVIILFAGCGNGKYAESGTLIIDADEAMKLMTSGSWILLDAQKTTSFEKEHVDGAVNIERNDVTVKRQVANLLAPASQIAEAAGEAGITADSNIVIYDDNNSMDSGRLAWTFMIYGHKGQIKIVSGGLQAMKAEKAVITKGDFTVPAAVYTADALNAAMVIDKDEILELLDNPQANTRILDVRTDEEYNDGTIPGAIHIEYLKNNFSDITYRPVQQIRILYKDADIMPEDTIIIFCKSSIRATQSWAALYNAGYRNLRIYDGAWLEWSLDSSLPVYVPEIPGKVQIQVEDAS